MEKLDLKSVDAVIVGAFKECGIGAGVCESDAYGYAVEALCEEGDPALFGTDASTFIAAAFELGVRLSALAIDNPLRFDYGTAKKYVDKARADLADFRSEVRTHPYERTNREPEPVA